MIKPAPKTPPLHDMTLTNSINGFDGAQELLIKLVEQSPEDWETRKRVVQVLYDSGFHREASKLVWNAPEVPPVTDEIVFTAKIVAMGQPERAVRLVSTMVESNRQDPAENLKVAKALMKQGLTHMALRFYGAATAGDTELIDDDFELAVVQADCGDESWRELTDGDDFPWDGPQETSLSDLMGDGGDGEASATDILLNGMTQPVPLKAPARQPADGEGAAAETPADRPAAPVKAPKPILSPAAEALVKQQADSAATETAPAGQAADEDGSFSSLVNFFKNKEMEEEPEAEPPVKSQPLATVATSVDTSAHSSVDSREKLPPAPSSPLVQGYQPRPSEALVQVMPEPAAPAPEPAAAAPQPSVFSGRPVSEPQAPQPQSAASEEAPRPTEPVVEASKPISSQLAPVVEPSAAPVAAPEDTAAAPEPDVPGDSVSDEVANVLAEREVAPPESSGDGLFSRLKGMFNRSKPHSGAAKNAGRELVESAAAVPSPSSEPTPQPAVPSPASMATTVLRKPEQEQHEPPKELDGRTQLVALAPEDGSVFFDRLAAKYNDYPAGQLPHAAEVARDMANVDYVQLIREACSKDLNAFSKLLGLHRVMTESSCTAWVEDMDLLRKGYGDAVLATVVSKYSVAECREILGAVYQRPSAQAAAG